MDFPICFAAVRLLGVERIGHYEHVAFESVKRAINTVWPRAPDTPAVEPHSEETANSQRNELSAEEAPNKPDGEASMSQITPFPFYLSLSLPSEAIFG